ncbi:MAG: hypothetical protein Q4E87_05615 [bacterium]|nr:hypothetical protein [bacterium]
MSKIIAHFEEDHYCKVSGLWQYDYGQALFIQGLNLPKIVEVHFSLSEKNGNSTTRIAVTENNITSVHIPDTFLENEDTTTNYNVYAFIYLADLSEGNTEYRITMPVKARPKPDASEVSKEPELFRQVIEAVNKAVSETEQAAVESESWTHGHTDYPDRQKDNAAYYASQAKNAAEGISGRVEEGKKNIDSYVKEKETSLKGETGNVYFAAFKVIRGRLIMYSDPSVDKVCFYREGSRLKYRLAL